MSKQLICPMAFNRKPDMPCLEENCSLWIPKGMIEKTIGGTDNSMTTYSPEGCCAFKAIGMKR